MVDIQSCDLATTVRITFELSSSETNVFLFLGEIGFERDSGINTMARPILLDGNDTACELL
jgi:hypothetical protein